MGRERSTAQAGISAAGLLELLVIYFVWGSTYLAIRVAVRPGAGFGPFWLGASRVLVAGLLLLAIAALARQRLKPTGCELAVLAASGVLILAGIIGVLRSRGRAGGH
jgi:drug/metabolite transporter (DMT)-like permease